VKPKIILVKEGYSAFLMKDDETAWNQAPSGGDNVKAIRAAATPLNHRLPT
jgi:hypothetical protein